MSQYTVKADRAAEGGGAWRGAQIERLRVVEGVIGHGGRNRYATLTLPAGIFSHTPSPHSPPSSTCRPRRRRTSWPQPPPSLTASLTACCLVQPAALWGCRARCRHVLHVWGVGVGVRGVQSSLQVGI